MSAKRSSTQAAWDDISGHLSKLSQTDTFQERMRMTGLGIATFIVLVTITSQAKGALDARQLISVLCLGLITLWPVLFKRSAYITALVQVSTLLATFILEAGCQSFFASEWCVVRGYQWLFYLAVATLYAVIGTYALRKNVPHDSWKSGPIFGSMAALPYIFLISSVDRTALKLPKVTGSLGDTFVRNSFSYLIPLALIAWLVWELYKEKRGRTWKQIFSL